MKNMHSTAMTNIKQTFPRETALYNNTHKDTSQYDIRKIVSVYFDYSDVYCKVSVQLRPFYRKDHPKENIYG